MAVAQSLVIINYMAAGRLLLVPDLFAAGLIVFVTFSSLTLLGLSVFYLTFACR
jgi:hypothetical protein